MAILNNEKKKHTVSVTVQMTCLQYTIYILFIKKKKEFWKNGKFYNFIGVNIFPYHALGY